MLETLGLRIAKVPKGLPMHARRSCPGVPRARRRRLVPPAWLVAVGGRVRGRSDFATPRRRSRRSGARRRPAPHDAGRGRQAVVEGVRGHPALDRLVELAYRQNLPLQIAGLRIVEARAQLAIATGQQYPAGAGGLRAASTAVGLSENVANAQPASIATISTTRSGFDAAWELDFWGKYRRGVEAEAASLLATVADYDAALVSLTAEVARTYVVIRTFEVLIEQARGERRAFRRRRCGSPSRASSNGATSELDVAQATTLLESTRASIPAAADRAAAGPERPEHAARAAAGRRRAAAGRAQGDPEGAREGGGRRAGRDAAPASGHPQRRAACRRAVRPHRHRQGGALSELLAVRHDRAAGAATAAAASAQPVLHRAASSTPSGPRINWPFFNYGRLDERRARRGRAVPAAARQLPQHRAQGGAGGGGRAGRLSQRPGGHGVRAERGRPPRSGRWSWRWCSTGKAPSTTSACWTRSARCCSSRTAWPRRARPSSTNLIALYKALGGGWELRQGQPVVPDADAAAR